jgi:hypothetical protein
VEGLQYKLGMHRKHGTVERAEPTILGNKRGPEVTVNFAFRLALISLAVADGSGEVQTASLRRFLFQQPNAFEVLDFLSVGRPLG